MIFGATEFTLKDGREALLRSPREEEAWDLLQLMRQACGETEFLTQFPEEWDAISPQQARTAVRFALADAGRVPIVCFVGGRMAGECQLIFRTDRKVSHRATASIAILQEYWNLGIGTKMFQKMIQVAQDREGVRTIELNCMAGNSRARALYEKMGFHIMGIRPEAIRQRDGTLLDEYMMARKLCP